jgi:hypothetical protein
LREIGEARIAGAEVVDRDAHARFAQAAHDADRLVRVLHQVAFRELQLEQAGIDAGGAHHRLDAHVELLVAELPGRQVDRHSAYVRAG